jgi:dipeptidyl aminopeptidase/acylaminoacyl peptidase
MGHYTSGDNSVKLWDLGTGKELPPLVGHSHKICSAAFSPDGKRLVSGSANGSARVWDTETGRQVFPLSGHRDPVWSVAFSFDGRRIVTASGDHSAKVWDAASGRELLALNGHIAEVWSAAFSPDGHRIVTGSADQTARVWDAASGLELLQLRGHLAGIKSVAFSPDSQMILTGGADQIARVWETRTGRHLLTLEGHVGEIWAVSFSPDGKRILTASGDNTAKVWDARNGRELLTLRGHYAPIASASFSPDGQRLVTCSLDLAARMWQAASFEQVARWQNEERGAQHGAPGRQPDQWAVAERERAARVPDEGAITQWLFLGPINVSEAEGSVQGLDQEQVPHERNLKPSLGQPVMVKGREMVWRALQVDDYIIDLNLVRGPWTERCVAYLVCYIWSESEHRGLQLRVGSGDRVKVYLNEEQVQERRLPHAFLSDRDIAEGIHLRAGRNVLVFKTINEFVDWKGSVRLTDKDGKPVKGIQVNLSAEAVDAGVRP